MACCRRSPGRAQNNGPRLRPRRKPWQQALTGISFMRIAIHLAKGIHQRVTIFSRVTFPSRAETRRTNAPPHTAQTSPARARRRARRLPNLPPGPRRQRRPAAKAGHCATALSLAQDDRAITPSISRRWCFSGTQYITLSKPSHPFLRYHSRRDMGTHLRASAPRNRNVAAEGPSRPSASSLLTPNFPPSDTGSPPAEADARTLASRTLPAGCAISRIRRHQQRTLSSA